MTVSLLSANERDVERYVFDLAGQAGSLSAALKCLLVAPDNEGVRELAQQAYDEFEAWWSEHRGGA